MALLLQDGTTAAPKLRVYLNLDTLSKLRTDTVWPNLTGEARYERLARDGFEGVQLTTDAPPPGHSLPYCGMARVNQPGEADEIVRRHAGRGDLCLTVHAGWGLEDDDAIYRLVESILTASMRHDLPTFLETHRATVTQDLWRTVQLVRRFPELRLNADYSHYYCGQEIPYGDWETKLAFMEPIFARTGFMHGRIASAGCMQVPLDADLTQRPVQAHGGDDYMQHFRELWVRAMLGFLGGASTGNVLIFAPEILSGASYYARLFPDPTGALVEESDRYGQALLLKEMAKACFAEAQRRFAMTATHKEVTCRPT